MCLLVRSFVCLFVCLCVCLCVCLNVGVCLCACLVVLCDHATTRLVGNVCVCVFIGTLGVWLFLLCLYAYVCV